MKRIPIYGTPLFALVDADDYEVLKQYTWCLHRKTKYLAYVFRYEKKKDEWRIWRGRRIGHVYKRINMHKQIMNTPRGYSVDHVNGDPLDNRRRNLRLATQSQQMQNLHQRTVKDKKSDFKGVTKNGLVHGKYKLRKPWLARIRVNGKLICLGFFTTEVEAARAYNEAAVKYFGEFACINVLDAEAIK